MRVIKVGYSSFNADALEGMSQEEISDMFPNDSKDIIKGLCVQLKAPKKAKKVEKVVKPKEDKPTED